MNKQSKNGNISWTDYTWNPIKGLCPVGCWYCYARAMYKRFNLYKGHKFPYVPISGVYERHPQIKSMRMLKLPKKPSKIFICSTYELFHPSTIGIIRESIFNVIIENPQHTFQILTKMPENIDRPMPGNVHLGVSITGIGDQERMSYLHGIKAKIKFISWEPLLDNPFPPGWNIPKCVNWAIVGRLTGFGHKRDPHEEWIGSIIMKARERRIPIFLKNNLKEIWDGKLIQEFLA